MTTGTPRRRVGAGEITLLVVLGFIAVLGGTQGRLFVAALAVLAVIGLLRRTGAAGSASRLSMFGSILGAIGVAALVLGRADLAALVVVAFVVDTTVGRWRLAAVRLGAATARSCVAGEWTIVEVRVRGVRGPVLLRLLDPSGDPVRMDGDGSSQLPHLAEHRGVYDHIRIGVAASGWLATITTRRIDAVPLDAPIAVHPRSVPVETPDVPDSPHAWDDPPAAGSDRRGYETQQVRALRPYVSGDPPRRVHWPTTARRGELAVVEFDAEVRDTVTLVVELPALPCTVSHHGTHHDHLDLVTGQARSTAQQLMSAGVPVSLTTVEVDAEGRPRTVSSLLRSQDELGHRLASAREGTPALPADVTAWVVGPEAGRARPWAVTAGTPPADVPSAGVVACPSDAAHPGQRTEGSDALDQQVSGTIWIGTILGGLTALLLAEIALPVPLVVPAGIAAAAAVLVRSHRRVAVHVVGVTIVLVGVTTAAMLDAADEAQLSVALAVAWTLPRLVGLRLLASHGPSAEREADQPGAAWGWPNGASAVIVACLLGVATIGVPVATAVATIVVVAFVLLLRGGLNASGGLDAGGGVGRGLGRLLARTAVVSASALLILPLLAWGADQTRDGLEGDRAGSSGAGSGTWIGHEDDLDLTRPRPDRDRVVLTVEADVPALLRDRSFVHWDGRRWSGGPSGGERVLEEPAVVAQVAGVVGDAGRWSDPTGPRPGAVPDDATEVGSHVVNRQKVTIQAAGAAVLPAAARAVSVRADTRVVALADETLHSMPALMRGGTYEVTSHMPTPTEATLRAASAVPVPADIRERYASPPQLSDRAMEDIHAVAGHLSTPYDQVRALESWLGDQVAYSLDAPLPPQGVDVVDHFLYDAREGWCQQIATTLTLALRELGVPARLVTGYVASEWDGRRFVVRERHAHAWVEVHFPGVGWQEFDPTAVVPGAADAEAPSGPESPGLGLLVLAAAVLGVATIAWLVRRRLGRGAGATPDTDRDPRPWATAADRRIRRLGERLGVDRAAGEGVVEHASRLADEVGDTRLHAVARLVEQDAYDRIGVGRADRQAAEAVLDAVAIEVVAIEEARRDATASARQDPPVERGRPTV